MDNDTAHAARACGSMRAVDGRDRCTFRPPKHPPVCVRLDLCKTWNVFRVCAETLSIEDCGCCTPLIRFGLRERYLGKRNHAPDHRVVLRLHRVGATCGS